MKFKRLAKTIVVASLALAPCSPKLSPEASADGLSGLYSNFVTSSSPVLDNLASLEEDVMLSDIDPSLTQGNYSLDSIFKNLNLEDTTARGYFHVDSLTHPSQSLPRQIYNRSRLVLKDGSDYESDWRDLKWNTLSDYLHMKPGHIPSNISTRFDFLVRFGDDISTTAKKYSLNVSDLMELLLEESGLNQFSLSSTYCPGPGQLSSYISLPKYPFDYRVSTDVPEKINPLNGPASIDRAGEFFAHLQRKFDGNLDIALTGYNAGEFVIDSAIRTSQTIDLASILAAKDSTGNNYILSDEARSYASNAHKFRSQADFYASTLDVPDLIALKD